MKKKISFQRGKMKELFFQHVEKICFGLAVLAIVGFFYSALQKTPYEKVPEDLDRTIAAANTNMQQASWDQEARVREGIEQPKFEETAQKVALQVPSGIYTGNGVFKFDESKKIGSKRGKPALLPIRNLEVHTDTGAFALKNPDGPPLSIAGLPQGAGPDGGTPKEPPPSGNKNKPKGLRGMLGQGGGEGGGPDGGPGGVPPAGLRGGTRPGAGKPGPQGLEGGPGGITPGGPGGEGGDGGLGSEPLVEEGGVNAPEHSKLKGVQYAIIKGLIPWREQKKAFEETFSEARYTTPNDFPYYVGYRLWRAEVDESGEQDPEKLKWVALNVPQAFKDSLDWVVIANEVVDPAYTDEILTFPLGPLLMRNWGEEVTHSKIKILKFDSAGSPILDGGPDGTGDDEPELKLDGNETDNFDAILQRRRQQGTSGGGMDGGAGPRGGPRGGGQPYGEGGGGGKGMGGFIGGGGQAGGLGGMIGGPRGGGDGGIGGGYGGSGVPIEDVEFKLFRFFDFTVKEGKRYRYRVQPLLMNPNFEVSPQFLEAPDLAVGRTLEGPISEVSPIAAVSSFSGLLAGNVVPATVRKEVTANLMAIQYDKEIGVKAVYECADPASVAERTSKPFTSVSRGQVIHFTANVDVRHPITRMKDTKDVDFTPNAVLVDIRGGGMLPGRDKEKEPGELLLVDSNGWLIVRSELEDIEAYRRESSLIRQLKQDLGGSQPDGGGLPDGPGGGRLPLGLGGKGEGS